MKETKKATAQKSIEELNALLDQKNRELEIEAAVEQVQVRTMAMHKSDELREVVSMIYKGLEYLGIDISLCLILIYDWKTKDMEWWSSGQEMEVLPESYRIPITREIENNALVKRYLNDLQSGVEYSEFELKGEVKKKWDNYIFNYSDLKNMPEKVKSSMMDYKRVLQCNAFMSCGTLEISMQRSLTNEEIYILKRFASVIDLTFTRVRDLQNAEAQAHEAEIQLALERVRARTMAMQQSSELAEAGNLVFQQIKELGVNAVSSWFWFIDLDKDEMEIWTTHKDQLAKSVKVKASDYWTFKKELEAWKNNKQFYKLKLNANDFKKLLKEVFGINIKLNKSDTHVHLLQVRHKFGFLGLGTLYEATEEEMVIYVRFAKVFEQTYTRFLDLKKAEAQAREAKIEAALERVRAASMAMHHSEEIQKVIRILHDQLDVLDIPADSAQFNFQKENSKDLYMWISSSGEEYSRLVHLPYIDNPIFNNIWENKDKVPFSDLISKKDKNQFFRHAFKNSILSEIKEDRKKMILNADGLNRSLAVLDLVGLSFLNYRGIKYSDDHNQITGRLIKVFKQAYTRFLDLKKAEAQAREAQIEAALERVRARSMAMHHSNELNLLVATFFDELVKLDLVLYRCIIWIFNDDESATMWMSNSEDRSIAESYFIKRLDHPFIDAIIKGWKNRDKKWVYELTGNNKKSIDQKLLNETDLQKLSKAVKKGILSSEDTFISGSFNKYSFIEASGPQRHSDEQMEIVARFCRVFEQTYARFLDLKKAEKQARDAIKQASLDRIRGEIASMRTTEDLNRITPVIWRELQALEVPFFRCGVFIVDEENEKVQVYLTTPEGKALAVLNLTFDANELAKNTVEHWRKNKIFKAHWNKEEFINWTKSMMELGQVQNVETYQGTSSAPESLNLHFVPFRQGMLYVGDVTPLSDEKLDLVKTLAEAFSIAYARYEDFKHLEEAKNKIELTLNDLKAAQTQLIQSEKMASLGELTAGIAHEIQNPLNFVNNFSEINKELLLELKEEIESGNKEEVNAITNDLIGNEEKINHHGKRAESIVKGMLLHSRGSSGKTEPTDINALSDEYLRLSYHGFRAKDKSFNADFKLEADKKLPKINVVPQDIGRVLLNLINNAFYAVSEARSSKLEARSNDYKPKVIVSTKKSGDKIEIKVKDNGPGIPSSIVDKIFQPFFTTKPTGQGTGLGLSLSYDIMKAHGGELKVETAKGAGSEFIIQLPII